MAATAPTSGVDLSLSGLASGFDWKAVVSQLADVERQPERDLATQQVTLQEQQAAVSQLVTLLQTFQKSASSLNDSTIFKKQTSSSSDSTVATVASTSATPKGSYVVNVAQLATNASQLGSTGVGAGIDSTAAATNSSAGFGIAVSSGYFTVNGTVIQVDNTKSLNDLMAEMQTAIGGGSTVSYNSVTDKVEIDGAGTTVVLGSSADTSNFLKATRLYSNDSDIVTSSGEIGGVNTANELSSELGASGGTFTINGVSISVNDTDSISDVLAKITSSTAGVSAIYDAANDRFVLKNKATGNTGFSLQDGTSDFLTKSGLLGGTLSAGKNAKYTVDGGATLQSTTNTLDSNSHAIPGLVITALATGSTTVTVQADTASMKSAISNFIDSYNQVESFIDTQTASTTDANGKVTAGILASDNSVLDIGSSLRSSMNADTTSPGLLKRLASLGYTSSGFTNSLTLTDESALDNFLANSPDDVASLFTQTTTGVAVATNNLAKDLVGGDGIEGGTLVTHVDNFNTQSKAIDDQVANIEKLVQADSERMTNEFVAMETAQSSINQQMQYISKIG